MPTILDLACFWKLNTLVIHNLDISEVNCVGSLIDTGAPRNLTELRLNLGRFHRISDSSEAGVYEIFSQYYNELRIYMHRNRNRNRCH